MKRWVVKVGSQVVCHGGPVLVRSWMHQVRTLRRDYDIEVVWVTSGAIASAVERTDFKKNKSDWKLSEKQALSAIGQPILMDMYNLALGATGLLGAQVLLTASDLQNSKRRKNFQKTVEQLLKWNVVPLLNENDAVATDEIKFGDNDSLSARVAGVIRADNLVILSDVEGLFDRDPKKFKSAKILLKVTDVDPSFLRELSVASQTQRGTGGMYSKIKASLLAASYGIRTSLVKGDEPNILTLLAAGKNVGTQIHIKKTRSR